MAIPSVLLVGAGKMGGALFAGWCGRGLGPSVLIDPAPSSNLARADDQVVDSPAKIPAGFRAEAVVLAIKPQMAESVVPAIAAAIPDGAVVLSIMAGTKVARLEALLGGRAPVVRAMPNTPAAIGQGITACWAGAGVSLAQKNLCTDLLEAVGEVVWLEKEALLDSVTAVSGSGPAYVFLLAEILEQAAVERGLPPDIAQKLARQTVSGAGALLAASGEDAAALRRAVTSPNGTTERALAVLMAPAAWPGLIRIAVLAAEARARELGRGD